MIDQNKVGGWNYRVLIKSSGLDQMTQPLI